MSKFWLRIVSIMFFTAILGSQAFAKDIYNKANVINNKINQVEKENIEIEKKYLINYNNVPKVLLDNSEKNMITQYYICFSPETRVRSVDDKCFFKTEKREISGNSLSRVEIEEKISEENYKSILNESKSNYYIKKYRYKIFLSDVLVELDVYLDELSGLVVAEVEFKSEEDAKKFNPPEWFGEDITNDKNFKNASLAKKAAGMRLNKANTVRSKIY